MQQSAWILALLLVGVGCEPAPASDDDGPDPGDASALDGAHPADAGIDARPAVTTDVVCQPHTRTIQYNDGRRTTSTASYAIIDTVGPETVFAVDECNYTVTVTPPSTNPDCPAGAVCSGSNTPSGSVCTHVYRLGQFVDGKLSITCGGGSEEFAANGSLTQRYVYAYTSVRLTVY